MRGNGRARYERYSKTAHRRRGVLTRRGLSTSPSLNPLAPQDGEDASVHSHDSESSHSMSLDHAADPRTTTTSHLLLATTTSNPLLVLILMLVFQTPQMMRPPTILF